MTEEEERLLHRINVAGQFMTATMVLYAAGAPNASLRKAMRDAAVIVGALNMALEPR